MTVCQGCEKPIRKYHKYCRSCGYMTVSDVCRELRVCYESAYRLMRRGLLRRIRLSCGGVRVRREDVEALLHPEWGWGPKRK